MSPLSRCAGAGNGNPICNKFSTSLWYTELATNLEVSGPRLNFQLAARRLLLQIPCPPVRGSAVEHRPQKLHQCRLTGLVASVHEVDGVRKILQLQTVPDTEAIDRYCVDFHSFSFLSRDGPK